MQTGDWQDCMLLRRVGQRSCVVRLANTGTTIQVGLNEPLDIGMSAYVTAIQPVKSRICLGEGLDDCALEVEWPSSSLPHGARMMMPPPIRFQRTTRTPTAGPHPVQRMKRRKMED